jgi:hypothetical protein
MEARLLSEESLNIQTIAIIESFCPEMGDPARCESLLTEFWPIIGRIMYPVFIEGYFLCGALDICMRRNPLKEWTCENCVKSVNDIADIIISEETITAVMDFLKVKNGVILKKGELRQAHNHCQVPVR